MFPFLFRLTIHLYFLPFDSLLSNRRDSLDDILLVLTGVLCRGRPRDAGRDRSGVDLLRVVSREPSLLLLSPAPPLLCGESFVDPVAPSTVAPPPPPPPVRSDVFFFFSLVSFFGAGTNRGLVSKSVIFSRYRYQVKKMMKTLRQSQEPRIKKILC